MSRRLWTREELLEVLALYVVTPFGRIHTGNPEIVALATRVGRTPSAVALKMANFAGLDPTLAKKGMANASNLDREVWDYFFEHIDHFAEAKVVPPDGFSDDPQAEFDVPVGATTRMGMSVQRLGQSFFRKMVLASYDVCCALTGVSNAEILVASHIVPWSQDESTRLNPANGICLNALHDRAFDRGLIAFSDHYGLLIRSDVDLRTRELLTNNCGPSLRLPTRFLPSQEYLRRHRERFQGDFRPA